MVVRFVDAFAGCGGLSLGLVQAGLAPMLAIEANSDAFATYRRNILDRIFDGSLGWLKGVPVSPHDVGRLLDQHRGQLEAARGTVDLLAGGPPCQGFSANGRRDPNDPRNELAARYLDLVDALQPPFLLLENVRGFTNLARADGVAFSDFIARELEARGYDVWGELVEASEWGVPQKRLRFFLVAAPMGALKGVNPFDRLRVSRLRFLRDLNLPVQGSSVADAIGDLRLTDGELIPDADFGDQGFLMARYKRPSRLSAIARYLRAGSRGQPSDMRLPRHSPKVVERFQAILDTCEAGRALPKADRERLGIKKRSTTPLAATRPSTTVTTLPDDRIHYCEPRTLTVRESARLQTFPDWFRFQGPYTSGGPRRQWQLPRYTQVGNAVPPLLARALGEMLNSLVDDVGLDTVMERSEICKVRGEVASKTRVVIPCERSTLGI